MSTRDIYSAIPAEPARCSAGIHKGFLFPRKETEGPGPSTVVIIHAFTKCRWPNSIFKGSRLHLHRVLGELKRGGSSWCTLRVRRVNKGRGLGFSAGCPLLGKGTSQAGGCFKGSPHPPAAATRAGLGGLGAAPGPMPPHAACISPWAAGATQHSYW